MTTRYKSIHLVAICCLLMLHVSCKKQEPSIAKVEYRPQSIGKMAMSDLRVWLQTDQLSSMILMQFTHNSELAIANTGGSSIAWLKNNGEYAKTTRLDSSFHIRKMAMGSDSALVLSNNKETRIARVKDGKLSYLPFEQPESWFEAMGPKYQEYLYSAAPLRTHYFQNSTDPNTTRFSYLLNYTYFPQSSGVYAEVMNKVVAFDSTGNGISQIISPLRGWYLHEKVIYLDENRQFFGIADHDHNYLQIYQIGDWHPVYDVKSSENNIVPWFSNFDGTQLFVGTTTPGLNERQNHPLGWFSKDTIYFGRLEKM